MAVRGALTRSACCPAQPPRASAASEEVGSNAPAASGDRRWI